MPRRSYKHINWQSLRDLLAKGATLRELSKTFDIPINTLQARSFRERWNVPAIRANLPRKSKTERKDSLREPHHLNVVRNGVLLPLVKLASYYQAADLPTLRKEQTQFLAFANAALKFLGSNDAKQGGGNKQIINLVLARTQPAELAVRAAREVEASAIPDSQSSEAESQVIANQGTPTVGEAKSASSASDLLG